MTPGSLAAPGVFLLVNRGPFARSQWRVADRSYVASSIDRDLWRHWHAGALRFAGTRASPHGEHFPLRHSARQFVRLLSARIDRPVHSQSHGDFAGLDRKSTRLNSSHLVISYAVFCLKKKKKK